VLCSALQLDERTPYSDEQLAGILARLATGGLMGNLVYVARVELNGKLYQVGPELSQEIVRALRPPPDARIRIALHHLDDARRALNAALGRPRNHGADESERGAV
jgi:hypothetical protein